MAEGKLAVVTGASTGIGRAIACALGEQGWNVAFSFARSPVQAQETKVMVEARGGQALSIQCDVGVKSEVDAFYEQVCSWKGIPDLLVNNAGIQTWASLLDLAEDDWDRVIRTNLKGCFLNTQAVGRLMRDAGKLGSIVNIGSGCNKLAFPKLVDYTASKGGIEQFTKVAAVELGPLGIRVNCVAPGAIILDRTAAEDSDYEANWSKITPLRRIGQAKDVADVVLYLVSTGSSFVSGQTIWVDGGVFSQAAWASGGTE